MKKLLFSLLFSVILLACQEPSLEQNQTFSSATDSISVSQKIKKTNPILATSTNLATLSDTVLARAYLDSSKAMMDSAKYDMALALTKKALELYRGSVGKMDLLMAKGYLVQGDIYSKNYTIDSIVDVANKAKNIGIKKLGNDNTIEAYAEKLLGTASVWRGDLDDGIHRYEKSLNIYKKHRLNNSEEVAALHNNLGITWEWKNEPELSNHHHLKALEIYSELYGEVHPFIARSYLNLGNLEKSVGNFPLALNYFFKGLDINERIVDKNHSEVAKLVGSIGITYNESGDFHQALIYNKKCLDILTTIDNPDVYALAIAHSNLGETMGYINELKKEGLFHKKKQLEFNILTFGENNPETAAAYASLASYQSDLKDYSEALKNFEKAISILERTVEESNPYFLSTLHNLGILYSNMGNIDKSFETNTKVLDLRKSVLGSNHPSLAYSLISIGDNLLDKKKYDKAKAAYLNALNILGYKRNIDTKFSDINDLKAFRSVLFSLTDCHYLLFKQNRDTSFLDSLQFYYLEHLALEESIQKEFPNLSSRQLYLSESKPIYEGAIRTYLWKDKKEEVSEIFGLFEKIKSRLLTEGIKREFNIHFASLPDSLKEKDHNINIDITYYEKKKFQSLYETKPPNDSLISVYQNKIFDLKRARDQLIETFKTDYPNYWNLKYNFEVASVKEVQSNLKKDQALIEYFTGDSSIFIFVATKDTFDVKEVKHDFPLTNWVSNMHDGMFAYYNPGNLRPSNILDSLNQQYSTYAHQLYEKLLLPIKQHITDESKLIIIPDGALGYVPFDALLTEPLKDFNSLRTANYLIKKYQISYAYSATLWLEMRNKTVRPKKGILAVAPSFPKPPESIAMLHYKKSGIRDSLYHLSHSLAEVEAVDKIWGADLLKDENANVQNFLDNASDYRILHLSTHGKADDRVGDYCFLAFTKVDSMDNLLYVRDLYNMHLNADMIVLSACETGLGELQRGEGILSMARGFVYAGAKSIISTLWSVEEESTKEIMESFYTNLKKGMDKDEALRQAKLSYLDTSSEPYPYHWAAFTAVGDMSPLEYGNSWWYYILGIVLVIGLLWFFRKGV